MGSDRWQADRIQEIISARQAFSYDEVGENCSCASQGPFIHHVPGQSTKHTRDEMFPPSWWMRDVLEENKMHGPSLLFSHWENLLD